MYICWNQKVPHQFGNVIWIPPGWKDGRWARIPATWNARSGGLFPPLALALSTDAIPAHVSLRTGAAAGRGPVQLDRFRSAFVRTDPLLGCRLRPRRCPVQLHRPLPLVGHQAHRCLTTAGNETHHLTGLFVCLCVCVGFFFLYILEHTLGHREAQGRNIIQDISRPIGLNMDWRTTWRQGVASPLHSKEKRSQLERSWEKRESWKV